MRHLSVLFFIFFFNLLPAIGQKPYDGLLAQLSELHEWDYSTDIDLDSLVLLIGEKLVRQLELGEVETGEDVPNLERVASSNGEVVVYTFSYHSGGAAGYIYNPVIQWKKSDGTYGAYELFPARKKGYFGVEICFGQIHPLPSEHGHLYLLTGNKQSSAFKYTSIALVVQIKNDYLILDYPAFYDAYSTLLYYDDASSPDDSCVACIEFLAKNKSIVITEMTEGDVIVPLDGSNEHEPLVFNGDVIFKFIEGRFKQFMPD